MLVTYAIGDVHGALHKLRSLIASCEAHAAGRPRNYVFLGDYVDRGAESAGVVQLLIDLEAASPGQVVALLGNHEAMLLAVAAAVMPAEDWLCQGGQATLRSYDVTRAQEMRRDHLDWLQARPLSFDDGRRFFVHAGIEPNVSLAAQNSEDLIWIREPFLSDKRDHGRLIVHGHTPLGGGRPDVRANRVNIDTGAVFGGPLTAAVFTDTATEPLTFLQAR